VPRAGQPTPWLSRRRPSPRPGPPRRCRRGLLLARRSCSRVRSRAAPLPPTRLAKTKAAATGRPPFNLPADNPGHSARPVRVKHIPRTTRPAHMFIRVSIRRSPGTAPRCTPDRVSPELRCNTRGGAGAWARQAAGRSGHRWSVRGARPGWADRRGGGRAGRAGSATGGARPRPSDYYPGAYRRSRSRPSSPVGTGSSRRPFPSCLALAAVPPSNRRPGRSPPPSPRPDPLRPGPPWAVPRPPVHRRGARRASPDPWSGR